MTTKDDKEQSNADSGENAPGAQKSQSDLADLADLAQLDTQAAEQSPVNSGLRRISPTEKDYQIRRIGVVSLGALIVLAPLALVWFVVSLFDSPGGSAGREFVGDFPIRAHISAEYNTLPGGPPVLQVSALPKLNAETGEWIVAFQETVYETSKIDEVYAEFVTPSVAFLIFEHIYAVTTNGGHTWSLWQSWDFSRVEDSSGQTERMIIDGVMLGETGSGLLFPVGVQSADSAFVTDDFGVSWDRPR